MESGESDMMKLPGNVYCAFVEHVWNVMCSILSRVHRVLAGDYRIILEINYSGISKSPLNKFPKLGLTDGAQDEESRT